CFLDVVQPSEKPIVIFLGSEISKQNVLQLRSMRIGEDMSGLVAYLNFKMGRILANEDQDAVNIELAEPTGGPAMEKAVSLWSLLLDFVFLAGWYLSVCLHDHLATVASLNLAQDLISLLNRLRLEKAAAIADSDIACGFQQIPLLAGCLWRLPAQHAYCNTDRKCESEHGVSPEKIAAVSRTRPVPIIIERVSDPEKGPPIDLPGEVTGRF